MNIIFDYNRTLFNPETGSLYQSTHALLQKLSTQNNLFLISRKETGREKKIEQLGIEQYFRKCLLVEEKNEELFKNLLNNKKKTLIVGDRVQDEIRFGNTLGYITVWMRQGKFKDQLPKNKQEQPNHIVNSIEELDCLLETYDTQQ